MAVKYFVYLTVLTLLFSSATAQEREAFTMADTLRGSNGEARAWWDVLRYDLKVEVDIPNKSIKGSNQLHFKVVKGGSPGLMQIDLQMPMQLDRVEYAQMKYGALPFRREGNVVWINFNERELKEGSEHTLILHFSGTPREAVRAPWDGGWVWAKDSLKRDWITVACQGLGASVWYPCKDYQADEPDQGASLSITVPDSLVAVGNGRLVKKTPASNGHTTWKWEVKSPINNYNIIPYIGHYVNWEEKIKGAKGTLDGSYWVLDYNLERSKAHFGRDVQRMITCFENWFGPYPFYEDSYKMIETPHLGMEHQSAVAYGNRYRDGYLGSDLSGSGWGTKWDYIIIHETGHEWFANNITTADIADMWVHEGFTTYSEVLFVECEYGKKAADEYCQGLRNNIENDAPIIGPYGVNTEGSGDMYFKGANLLHTIRQVINNDTKFREILKGLNKEFYHKITSSREVEAYFAKHSGKKLDKIFDQYLRQSQVPVLEYELIPAGAGAYTLKYRWAETIEGFDMPLKIVVNNKEQWIKPGTSFKNLKLTGKMPNELSINPNFYISTKKL
jgi:aminopeptidase N